MSTRMMLLLNAKDLSSNEAPIVTTAWSVQPFESKKVIVTFMQCGHWRTEVFNLSFDEFRRRLTSQTGLIDLRL